MKAFSYSFLSLCMLGGDASILLSHAERANAEEDKDMMIPNHKG